MVVKRFGLASPTNEMRN